MPKETHVASGSIAVTVTTTLYYHNLRAEGPDPLTAKRELLLVAEELAEATLLRGTHDDCEAVDAVTVEEMVDEGGITVQEIPGVKA